MKSFQEKNKTYLNKCQVKTGDCTMLTQEPSLCVVHLGMACHFYYIKERKKFMGDMYFIVGIESIFLLCLLISILIFTLLKRRIATILLAIVAIIQCFLLHWDTIITFFIYAVKIGF